MRNVLIISRATGQGAPQRRIDNLISIMNKCSLHTYLLRFNEENIFDISKIDDLNYEISLGNLLTMSRVNKLKRIHFGSSCAKKVLDKIKPEIVIIYSVISYKTARFIKKYCKCNNIKLIFDVVEFREKKMFPNLRLYLSYNRDNNIINTKVIGPRSNVVCISQYLFSYFKNRNCNCLYFPITFECEKFPKSIRSTHTGKIRFLYAGVPNNKRDLIANIVHAFAILPVDILKNVELYICGPDLNVLFQEGVLKSDLELLENHIIVTGFLKKDELYKIMLETDFTLLLKDSRKLFSIAGFPTKMSESFAFGIPMVANLTGDMSLYLREGFNGFVSEDESPESFSRAICRAVDYSNNNNFSEMKKNAYDSACDKLDTNGYVKSFSDFLKNLL